ncbi:MAG: ribonuclease HII [Cellulophaga sp.]|nr:ribonuclease HII [Cellulophaga sp.]
MKIKIIALVFILFINCKNQETTTDSLLAYTPTNAALIIKINDFDRLKSDLKNNDFLKNLEKTAYYNKLIKKIQPLEQLQIKNRAILSFVEIGTAQFEFLFKTKFSSEILDSSRIKNKKIEEINYEGKSFKRIDMDSTSIFSYSIGPSIFISSSPLLIENLIRSKEAPKTDERLQKLFSASSNTKTAVLFINTAFANSATDTFLAKNNTTKISDFSDWISIEADIEQNELNLTGISTTNSDTKFVSLFKDVEPSTNLTPNFAPINSKAILSYTFEDFQKFYKNQQLFLESLPKKDTVFNTVNELGIVYLANSRIVLLQNYDAEPILNFLDGKATGTSSYQGNDIIQLKDKNLLNSFKTLITNFETNYYTVIENTFIFSEDITALQNCISSFKSEATFNKSETYLNIKNNIADESNVLVIATAEGIDSYMKDNFKNNILKEVSNLDLSQQTMVAQLVSDQNFYHTSFSLKKLTAKTTLNMTAPLFTVRINSDITNSLQFVKNHITNKKEIIAQDQDNKLYLISADGKIIWQKELENKLISKVEQVDLYKNGRLQFIFATADKLIILDINGDTVKTFDKPLNDGVINSFSVFDYDNNRNYRFLIVQGKRITMLDNNLKVVEGFKFKEATSNITQAPKHFRINKKDYIVFPEENGTMRILSRTGEDRITVKEKIDFSQNEIFVYKNQFTTTDIKGVLYQIDEKGNTSKISLNLGNDHGLDATSTVLVTMNENTLTIKGKKVELELGIYTKPQIFYSNNKIYVSVTDLQNQKIYLFDSNAKILENFPVYGTSAIDLTDMDNDKKLEFVAKDLENSLIVYKIN